MTMNTPGENGAGMDEAHLGRAAALTLPPPVAGGTGPASIVFGSGLPDRMLHPREALGREITRVLRGGHDLGYSRGRGQDTPCNAVAARLNARSGGSLTGQDVAVTGGASAALAAVATALLDPGDVVLCERSTYPAAVATFRHRGARVAAVALDLHEPDVAAADHALREPATGGGRAKAIYVVAPFQGPTTATLSDRGAIAAMRTDLGVSAVLQEAVARLLEYAEHVAAACDHYRRKRDARLEALGRECGETATWCVPEGSFFVWLETVPSTRRLALAARDIEVGFVPGDYFAVDGADSHHIRLAYSHVDLDHLADGARRLAEALRRASHDAVPERGVPGRAAVGEGAR